MGRRTWVVLGMGCLTIALVNWYLSTDAAVTNYVLPKIAIIGTMKSGTGVLLQSLVCYQDSSKKLWFHNGFGIGEGGKRTNEVHFFRNSDVSKPTDTLRERYKQHFPVSLHSTDSVITIDKSPDYIRSHAKLAQLKAVVPTVSMILLYRKESSRLFSEFRHHCRHNRYIVLPSHVVNISLEASWRYLRDGRVSTPPTHNIVSGSAMTGRVKCSYHEWLRFVSPLLLSEEPSERIYRVVDAKERDTWSLPSEPGGSWVVGPEVEISHGFYDWNLLNLIDAFQWKDSHDTSPSASSPSLFALSQEQLKQWSVADIHCHVHHWLSRSTTAVTGSCFSPPTVSRNFYAFATNPLCSKSFAPSAPAPTASNGTRTQTILNALEHLYAPHRAQWDQLRRQYHTHIYTPND